MDKEWLRDGRRRCWNCKWYRPQQNPVYGSCRHQIGSLLGKSLASERCGRRDLSRWEPSDFESHLRRMIEAYW